MGNDLKVMGIGLYNKQQQLREEDEEEEEECEKG